MVFKIALGQLFMNLLAAELSALNFLPHILRLRKPNLLQNLHWNPVLAEKGLECSPLIKRWNSEAFSYSIGPVTGQPFSRSWRNRHDSSYSVNLSGFVFLIFLYYIRVSQIFIIRHPLTKKKTMAPPTRFLKNQPLNIPKNFFLIFIINARVSGIIFKP